MYFKSWTALLIWVLITGTLAGSWLLIQQARLNIALLLSQGPQNVKCFTALCLGNLSTIKNRTKELSVVWLTCSIDPVQTIVQTNLPKLQHWYYSSSSKQFTPIKCTLNLQRTGMKRTGKMQIVIQVTLSSGHWLPKEEWMWQFMVQGQSGKH